MLSRFEPRLPFAVLLIAVAAHAQQPQVFAVVDAREQVLSGKAPPMRTGTNYSMVGIPAPDFEFGRNVPLASGLGMYFQGYIGSTFRMPATPVPVDPSRDVRVALTSVAPRPGERVGLVVVINEWWSEGVEPRVCRKALTAYAVGPGGAVLAQSSAADHQCLTTFDRSEGARRDELFASLLNTPSMAAAMRGQVVAPPVATPPPPPPPGPAPNTAAPAGCSPAQVAKLKGYGLSADDLRRACGGQK